MTFWTSIASAKCASNGIYCLSTSSKLNRNGLIILEFYASSQHLVPGLNQKHQIYLTSRGKKVHLMVLETLKGEMNVTQVVFKPSSDLNANEVYKLEISNLPADERNPTRYNRSSGKWEALTFEISTKIDREMPTFNIVPTQQKKTLAFYGCGPASWVYFNVAGNDSSELFVRVNVKNRTTKKVTTYLLSIEDRLIKVGHGMCSGAFVFDNGDNFEAEFQLVDQSGNQSKATTAITFTKPINETEEE